jgi:hypothetical protein
MRRLAVTFWPKCGSALAVAAFEEALRGRAMAITIKILHELLLYSCLLAATVGIVLAAATLLVT